MDKTCDNCYWKDAKYWFCSFEQCRPKENICEKHDFECDTCGSQAGYKLNGKYYCSDCILAQFDVEESRTTQYMLDGEYLGSDEDMEEVISHLDGVEIID